MLMGLVFARLLLVYLRATRLCAAYLCLHMRRNLLYAPYSPPRRISPAQAVDQVGEFEQVSYAEQRPLPAQDDLGIRCDNIRPLRWNRANRTFIYLEQQRHAVAVIPVAYAGQLPPAERMEWMRHAYKTCGCD
jgi:hypothetical protein